MMISRFTQQDTRPSDIGLTAPSLLPDDLTQTTRGMGLPPHPTQPVTGAVSSYSTLPPASFRDAFCRRHGVAPERFEIEMMRRCFSRRARMVGWAARLVAKNPYAFDAIFVRSLGRARDAEEFKAELNAFRDHPSNRTWARRVLKLRLSIWRVLDVSDEILPLLRAADWYREMGSRPPWN